MDKPRLISILFNQRSSFFIKKFGKDLSERELAKRRLKIEYKKVEHLAIKANMPMDDYLIKNYTLTPEEVDRFINIGKAAINEVGSPEREINGNIGQLITALRLSLKDSIEIVKQLAGVADYKRLSILEREKFRDYLCLRYKAETGKDFEFKRTPNKPRMNDGDTGKVDKNCSTRKPLKARILIYPVCFLVIQLGLFYIVENLLGIEIFDERSGHLIYPLILMLVSFGIVSYLYNVIERKDYDGIKILRRMATIVLYCLLSGLLVLLPMILIAFSENSFYGVVKLLIELGLVYSIGGAIVISLAFVIAKIQGTDFKTEIHKITEFI